MGAWKVLGSDGLFFGFYKKSLTLVDESIVNFVKHVWSHPEDITAVNKTDICLIRNVSKLEFVS